MPISSLIVRTKEKYTEEISQKLKTIKGVRVEGMKYRDIVLVTDTSTREDDKAIWKEIEDLPGVLQCDLIYHNFEDEEEF